MANKATMTTSKSISFGTGDVPDLADALSEFTSGSYGAVNVHVSRAEHDRMPGSFDTTVTLTITE
ncbi:hypothetical protein SEA_FLAPPER_13 [Gordonia phage Flapper]|uniref:Uncharacterized protein n=1 Tax=Gordonia phage Flapper TaxID=2079415 RepID=A0A2L1IX63_9CAUD|nr:hypothetical protein KNT82_gp13 [Gordonia phage Flapper]AVD99758.1 hypothetical protein SEA_FLAPPER_13 [Gordonia phage Flapper]